LLLIGEQFYVTERVNTDINTGRVIVENIYHYDDLIVTRLEMTGKIAWSQRVAKEQYSSTEYDRCGYNVFLRDGTLAFVFNDDKENTALLLKDPKSRLVSWNGSRTSTITLVELNNNGVVLRSTLATEEVAEGSITPELGSSEVYRLPVLGFTKGRDFRFATFFKK
jgi:archaellin